MEKCSVCKSNRRQLLMLTCSHDVCIKCAADNYFLNNVAKKQNKKDDKKTKKQNYFCQICLEVTKIDQNTVNQLKQWYITNVNAKSSSKVNKNSGSQPKEIKRQPQRSAVQKPVPRPKRNNNQQNYNPYIEQNRSQQKRYDRSHHNDNKNYQLNKYYPQNQYDQKNNYHYQNNFSTQRAGRLDQKKHKTYQMPQEYQAKGLLRYNEGRMDDDRKNRKYPQQKFQQKRQINSPAHRYSTRPNQNNYYGGEFNIPPYQRPIQPRYSTRQQNNQRSGTSSKQKRVFGSIVKRDQIRNNENLKQQIIKAKDEQRKRINSYRSQQKLSSYYQPTYQNQNSYRRQHTETDSIQGSSARYPIKQQGPGRINTRRQNIRQNQQRQQQSLNKKRQVYLDLIGNQHSLEQQGSYIRQQSQTQSTQSYQNNQPRQSYRKNNNQKPQIINKFSNTAQSTYYNTQHTNTPISTKSPTNFQSNQQSNPNSNPSLPQQTRKLYCNIHQDQQIIYYCLQCKLLICSQCALYGQHKDHNIHTLKKAAFKLKQTLYILITQLNSYLLIEQQKQQLLLQQIKQIKIQSNKQKQKVKFAFQNFIKNVQNKYAQVLQQLQQSQLKALNGFTQQLDKTKQKCTQYFQRKNSMKNLFQTFAKNPTNNQLAAPYCQYDTIKNNAPSTNAPGTSSNQQKHNRVYRQFDDFFEQNSMTSQQRNFFNTNIEQLQAKISDYEEYVKKLKPQYQKIIYPTLYNRDSNSGNKRNSGSKSKQFFRQGTKSRRQSQQLHESLKFSETSLLIQPSIHSPQKMQNNYDDFLSQQDFIQQNNIKSLNLMIQKQLTTSQFSQLKQNLKLAHVDTIIESIKEIQEIIKEFRIQFRNYEMKVGGKR